ncbi:MAG: PEGA domain-containing protein [Deltaproteobacteria bacterium]|nr:PEGA domain-containing protein [Deltaproteobacteria bacterium]
MARTHKRRTLKVVSWCMALGLVCGASSGLAQRAPNPARDAFERGIHALETQRYVEALDAFEESYRLRPSPVAQYNVAVSQRGLGRTRAAIETFERYLAAPERSADRARLAQIRAELSELRGQIVTLRLTVRPENAALLVDGRPAQIAPDGLRLDPGMHVVEVSAEGFRSTRREVDMRPGSQVVLEVALESLGLGRLAVTSSVEGAVIRVDGREWGTSRVDRLIAPGEHQLELLAPRYDVYRRSVRVESDVTLRVDAQLLAEGAGTRRWLIPTLSVVGALAIAGGIFAVVYATGSPVPQQFAWGTFELGPR